MPLLKIFLPGLAVFLLVFGGILWVKSLTVSNSPKIEATPAPTSAPSATSKPKVKYPEDYTIVLVGDSMTEKLGNSDELRTNLKKYYPGKTFEVLNYSFGSTNILSVADRLEKETFHNRVYRPILEIDFDLIIVESFGHNPLSEYPLDEGLKKQAQALEKIVAAIKKENHGAKIVFLATISPNKGSYGVGQVDLSPEKRLEWANERIAYIKNHIDFANSHQIPIINVFQASLDQNGDGKLQYISSTDNIHPSPSGVVFISQLIADFIFENHFL